jgi:hypothetical protein
VTLTWRTLRDYALRFATFWLVCLVAAIGGLIPATVAVLIVRFAAPDLLAGFLWPFVALFAAFWLFVAYIGARWRKDWLWNRWGINIG